MNSSPLANATRSFTPQQPEPSRRYIIRADVHYDAESKVLTAHLELPGLTKRDLSITLSTCVYNRVRQVVVAGRSKPALSEAGYAIKERKYGEFSRTFAVPPETKVRFFLHSSVVLYVPATNRTFERTAGRRICRDARRRTGAQDIRGPTRRIRRCTGDLNPISRPMARAAVMCQPAPTHAPPLSQRAPRPKLLSLFMCSLLLSLPAHHFLASDSDSAVVLRRALFYVQSSQSYPVDIYPLSISLLFGFT